MELPPLWVQRLRDWAVTWFSPVKSSGQTAPPLQLLARSSPRFLPGSGSQPTVSRLTTTGVHPRGPALVCPGPSSRKGAVLTVRGPPIPAVHTRVVLTAPERVCKAAVEPAVQLLVHGPEDERAELDGVDDQPAHHEDEADEEVHDELGLQEGKQAHGHSSVASAGPFTENSCPAKTGLAVRRGARDPRGEGLRAEEGPRCSCQSPDLQPPPTGSSCPSLPRATYVRGGRGS